MLATHESNYPLAGQPILVILMTNAIGVVPFVPSASQASPRHSTDAYGPPTDPHARTTSEGDRLDPTRQSSHPGGTRASGARRGSTQGSAPIAVAAHGCGAMRDLRVQSCSRAPGGQLCSAWPLLKSRSCDTAAALPSGSCRARATAHGGGCGRNALTAAESRRLGCPLAQSRLEA
jgi:hypothetical protein